jgi:hypothetical protein
MTALRLVLHSIMLLNMMISMMQCWRSAGGATSSFAFKYRCILHKLLLDYGLNEGELITHGLFSRGTSVAPSRYTATCRSLLPSRSGCIYSCSSMAGPAAGLSPGSSTCLRLQQQLQLWPPLWQCSRLLCAMESPNVPLNSVFGATISYFSRSGPRSCARTGAFTRCCNRWLPPE